LVGGGISIEMIIDDTVAARVIFKRKIIMAKVIHLFFIDSL
jgi:hypothetical protein